MRFKISVLIGLSALAGCSSPPPPPPSPMAPPPEPVLVAPPPAARPTGEWTDWPLAAGDWIYRQDERGSIALFGPANTDAIVTLRCDKARQRIFLARAASGAGRIIIRSSSTMKEFAGQQTGGATPYIATEIMPRDAILDAMIFSRGRIAIDVAGQMPLAIPSWSEIGRVVEDCRV
jgi:hypothetical protein